MRVQNGTCHAASNIFILNGLVQPAITDMVSYHPLCNQSLFNENTCSGDKSSAKVLFEHPSTTFVHTKT